MEKKNKTNVAATPATPATPAPAAPATAPVEQSWVKFKIIIKS